MPEVPDEGFKLSLLILSEQIGSLSLVWIASL